MSILCEVKSLARDIQKKGDVDQYKKVLDLQARIMDLLEENSKLKKDIDSLKKRLEKDISWELDYEFYL